MGHSNKFTPTHWPSQALVPRNPDRLQRLSLIPTLRIIWRCRWKNRADSDFTRYHDHEKIRSSNIDIAISVCSPLAFEVLATKILVKGLCFFWSRLDPYPVAWSLVFGWYKGSLLLEACSEVAGPLDLFMLTWAGTHLLLGFGASTDVDGGLIQDRCQESVMEEEEGGGQRKVDGGWP